MFNARHPPLLSQKRKIPPQERKFCTKTAALNARLPRLCRKISPRFILAKKPQCWMSDFHLSSLKREQFPRDLFWLKNHSVECQTSASLEKERETLLAALQLPQRARYLGFPRTRVFVIVFFICDIGRHEKRFCQNWQLSISATTALAAFLPWAVESIPSKVSASRACKASSGSHRGFRCFLGSRIQYYMIQNTVQYLLGRRMQYSMIQNTAPQLLGSVRPTGSHHTPLTLSPEGLPHPNPMHNLGKIPILFRKVLMKYVFLILCYVFPKVVANKLKLHTFQTLWGNHLVAAERHKGNMPEGSLEESKKYTGNTNTNTNTNKKYTGNTKEGFTGNVTCHVLQPAAYPLQPF